MPMYEYRCPNGHTSHSSFRGGRVECPACLTIAKRVWGFSMPTPATLSQFEPHFNRSVGKVVHSRREFEDALKQGSDEQTARLGVEHRYVPHDPREWAESTTTEEGVYEEKKAQRDLLGWDVK